MNDEAKKIIVKTVSEDDNKVEKEEYVICEVCGHANKASNGLCEMCSNYLY